MLQGTASFPGAQPACEHGWGSLQGCAWSATTVGNGGPLLCSGALPLRSFLSCCFSLPFASILALHPPILPPWRSPAASPASALPAAACPLPGPGTQGTHVPHRLLTHILSPRHEARPQCSAGRPDSHLGVAVKVFCRCPLESVDLK